MNSPPDSTKNPASPSGTSIRSSLPRDMSSNGSAGSTPKRQSPPSPASTGTAIAVGSCNEELLYQSVEEGGTPTEEDDAAAFGIETASISSSIRDHIYEGGLRYHAYHAGKYAFPNDELEQDRDDMKHNMSIMLCDGKYFLAPVEEALSRGAEVLDLGTGTGIWCIQLGDKYPDTQILGMDLSPIQPVYVPPNVKFVLDDIEHDNGWDLPENHFDFIHVRHTLHSIRDRSKLMERIYRHLKPGGWVEVQELEFYPHCDDDSMTASTPYAFRDFLRYLADGLRAFGSELLGIRHVETEMTTAGFEDVKRRTLKCPVGAWPKDKRLRVCGVFMRTAIMDGLRGLTKKPFGDGLGWTKVQIEMFLVDVRRHVMDGNFHTYLPFHVVYGRRPLQ